MGTAGGGCLSSEEDIWEGQGGSSLRGSRTFWKPSYKWELGKMATGKQQPAGERRALMCKEPAEPSGAEWGPSGGDTWA